MRDVFANVSNDGQKIFTTEEMPRYLVDVDVIEANYSKRCPLRLNLIPASIPLSCSHSSPLEWKWTIKPTDS